MAKVTNLGTPILDELETSGRNRVRFFRKKKIRPPVPKGIFEVREGDCIAIMNEMEPESIAAVICDPPYELGFMAKEWDRTGIAFNPETWKAALRVLKPGGHLLAFGGARTYHRIAVAIEDAGFEIRDCIIRLYSNTMPKGLNISKMIDKAHGVKRRTLKIPFTQCRNPKVPKGAIYVASDGRRSFMTPEGIRPFMERAARDGYYEMESNEPATDEARQWLGWNTALKPTWEPIILARKPLIGTITENIQKYGTGGLNIDACRVGSSGGTRIIGRSSSTFKSSAIYHQYHSVLSIQDDIGRWPANTMITHSPFCEFKGSFVEQRLITSYTPDDDNYNDDNYKRTRPSATHGTKGGFNHKKLRQKQTMVDEVYDVFDCVQNCPARIVNEQSNNENRARIYYQSKETNDERWAYCPQCEEPVPPIKLDRHLLPEHSLIFHPTQKPVDLMCYLIRLVTPPGGVVLDPFMGSGSTLDAARWEGVQAIGIDKEPIYVKIARARVFQP